MPAPGLLPPGWASAQELVFVSLLWNPGLRGDIPAAWRADGAFSKLDTMCALLFHLCGHEKAMLGRGSFCRGRAYARQQAGYLPRPFNPALCRVLKPSTGLCGEVGGHLEGKVGLENGPLSSLGRCPEACLPPD